MDYIKYIENYKKEFISFGVKEESEDYKLTNGKVNNEHDKTFRTIFDNKREVSKLIKDKNFFLN